MIVAPSAVRHRPTGPVGAGLTVGVLAAFVDHLALTGRIGSVAVVALLVVSAAAVGAVWRWSGAAAVFVIWACVVLTHVAKHQFGWPGALQPDTWESMRSMAAFTLAVCGAGLCGGVLLRMAASD